LTEQIKNINKGSALTELVHEKLGERRFYALAKAVREHEERAAAFPHTIARHDEELYRRFRLICGEL
jgi:hypothetical protein